MKTKHGLALCCNSSPEYKLRTGSSAQYICTTCDFGAGKGVWSQSMPGIASLWNKSRHTTVQVGGHTTYNSAPELDAGQKWRFIEFTFTAHLPYSAKETIYESSFMLFATEERPEKRWLLSEEDYSCIINDSRCFKQFSLRGFHGTEVVFNLPIFKRHTPFSIYLNRVSTGGNWWYSLNITAYNQKWIEYFTKQLKAVIT